MRTLQVEVADPTVLPIIDVDWTSGITSVVVPNRVVNIPIGVGIPGLDGAATPTPRPTYQLTGASSWSGAWPLPGRLPALVILTAAGKEVDTDVTYDVAGNTVFVSFPGPFTGSITLT